MLVQTANNYYKTLIVYSALVGSEMRVSCFPCDMHCQIWFLVIALLNSRSSNRMEQSQKMLSYKY